MPKIKHSVTLTEEETQQLNAMADTDERSRSAVIGRLIRQEHKRRIKTLARQAQAQGA